MNDDLMQYGVAIAIVVVVLRLVFDFLRDRNNRAVSPEQCRICNVRQEESAKLIEKLWDIHDQYDEDGAPKWYIPRKSYDIAMERQSIMLENQNKILEIVKKLK